MARQFLYKVVSNDKLPACLADGFVPRPGVRNGVEHSPRVWLFTDIRMAYFQAWKAIHKLHPKTHNFPFGYVDNDIAWRWYGDGWYAVRTELFSIITIDGRSVEYVTDDMPEAGMTREQRRTIVHTDDHIPASAIINAAKLDKTVFQSQAFRRFANLIGKQVVDIIEVDGELKAIRKRPKALKPPNIKRRRKPHAQRISSPKSDVI